MSNAMFLVVARGRDAGARLRVDDEERIVGRARDADLVLLDPRVSRHHLRVRREGDRLRLRAVENAAPFLVAGEPREEADLGVDDVIVVGDSALVVACERDARDDEGPMSLTTDVNVLMSGLGAEVRGLASAAELVDALDAAPDEEAIGAVLRRWGKANVHAVDATLAVGDAIDDALRALGTGPPALVERGPLPSGDTLLSAPAHSSQPAWVTFTCTLATEKMSDGVRRLAVVAARLAGSRLAQVRSLRASEETRDVFRREAVGSARTFLGDSPAAREVARLATRLAASNVIVLLEGETGVGKTFLARLLHESGSRATEPLRIVNCAAIPDSLIESELFGHERGAFTGAVKARPGAFEAAGGGTVLLDEIGELPLPSQAKLLHVLEEKRFERLGSNQSIALDARVLVATNRDLATMAEEGTFRRDLFYRIAIVKLRVPPLRERGADLELLAKTILADLVPTAGRRVDGFSASALTAIRRYSWPGNVRELRNAIERALVVGEGREIDPHDLPEVVHGGAPPQPSDEALVRLPVRLDEREARSIQAALAATGGNQRRAASLLGIDRVTLHRKLKAIGKKAT